MEAPISRFVWYELTTTDPEAATRFYEAVIGWTSRDGGFPGQSYTLLAAGSATVAGLLALPDGLVARGIPPHWTGYIGVGDLDGVLARIRLAGGTVHFGPEPIAGVGSLAVAGDPQGAVFSLLQPEAGMSGPPPAARDTPGHVQWRELHADDWAAAFAFYEGMFGWTKASAVDMGAMGTYQTFNIGEVWSGGVMTRAARTPRPFWLYYINVDSAKAAAARVVAAGGRVVSGPHQVPGGGWTVQALDPQGAMFAMVGPA